MNDTRLIFKQIPKIMADLKPISKDQKGHNFSFRGIDDVYNALQPLMAKYKVFTTTKVLKETVVAYESTKGAHGVQRVLTVQFDFYAEDGSSVQCITHGEGIDYGDKCSNKCMAIAHKYALLQTFAVPTKDNDDPDQQSHESAPRQQQGPPSNYDAKNDQRPITEPQLKRLFAIAKKAGFEGKEDLKPFIMQNLKRKPDESLTSIKRCEYEAVCTSVEKEGT